MAYREWLPGDERRQRSVERSARNRRRIVRALAKLSTVAPLRPVAEIGMRNMFDRLASDWERIRAEPIYRESFDAGLLALPQKFPALLSSAPREVLDVASGTGIASGVLRERLPASQVTGIDISPEMVKLARELVPGVQFDVGSSMALPYESGRFDLVCGLDAIFTVAELARVTAPGGAVLVVYSKGGDIPVSRSLEELRGEFDALGQGWLVAIDQSSSWWLWAHLPAGA